MKYRAAIGSFNGEYVDQHFGHTKKYYIYEFDDETGTVDFLERRFVDTKCECHADEGNAFSEVFEALNDVSAIVISRIGRGATSIVENHGFVLYESTSKIENVIQKIADSRLYEEDQWRKIITN